ncbi:hypothetical protein [Cupriavidus oxalaticus]|uniref:hypothetical protein n=1 Tax=Cupriavidus oxalaticus TaxID=96344 RepID=UPI001244D9BA|nr:hypothetical protein [Cupriavidus oxalaticus]
MLQKEVRAMTRRVHGQAARSACSSNADYLARAAVLIDEQIERADARERVICFASAAEIGLSLRHQGERCRLAAIHTGSDAIRVLYWTAVRRMQRHTTDLCRAGDSGVAATDRTLAGKRSLLKLCAVTEERATGEASTPSELCRHCHGLQLDSHCAAGHGALHPISGKYFRCIGMGILSEAQGYECSVCKTTWTQHKNKANPFSTWTMKRQ